MKGSIGGEIKLCFILLFCYTYVKGCGNVIPYKYSDKEFVSIINYLAENIPFIEVSPPNKLKKIKPNINDQLAVVLGFYKSFDEVMYQDIYNILRVGKVQFKIADDNEAVVYPDLSGNIHLEGNIRSYYTITHEAGHLIPLYRMQGKIVNEDFGEVESLFMEKCLGKYLADNNIISIHEKDNQEAVNHNTLYHAVQLAKKEYSMYERGEDVSTLHEESNTVSSLQNQIRFIYGDIFATELFSRYENSEQRSAVVNKFVCYLNNKDQIFDINSMANFFNIDKNTLLINYVNNVNRCNTDIFNSKKSGLFSIFKRRREKNSQQELNKMVNDVNNSSNDITNGRGL